jgi:hypothetical protein
VSHFGLKLGDPHGCPVAKSLQVSNEPMETRNLFSVLESRLGVTGTNVPATRAHRELATEVWPHVHLLSGAAAPR